MTILDLPDRDEIDAYLATYYNDAIPQNGKQTKQSVHLARILKFIGFCKEHKLNISSESEIEGAADIVLQYLKDTAEYGHTLGYLKRECSSLKLLFRMIGFQFNNPLNSDKIKLFLEEEVSNSVHPMVVYNTQDLMMDGDLGIPSKQQITVHLTNMFSKQTCYDYQSRIGMFLKFCRKYKLDIRGDSDAVAQVILKYLNFKLEMKVSFSYLRRANASIKILFDMVKMNPNPSDSAIVVAFLKDMLAHKQNTWTEPKDVKNQVLMMPQGTPQVQDPLLAALRSMKQETGDTTSQASSENALDIVRDLIRLKNK